MNRSTAIMTLFFAAALEVGGDAIIRAGLHKNTAWHRYSMFAAAAIVLFAYGLTVNAPPWDFGRLLGLYVVFFFVIAQLISWLFFKQTPSPMMLIGGSLIVAGGIVISFAKT
jgi:drug/metabolite transporter superfamily protein YnfA